MPPTIQEYESEGRERNKRFVLEGFSFWQGQFKKSRRGSKARTGAAFNLKWFARWRHKLLKGL